MEENALIGNKSSSAKLQANIKNASSLVGDVSSGATVKGRLATVYTSTMPAVKIGVVTLFANAWVGENNCFSQVVYIEGATERSQVDITPSAEQLMTFYEKDLAFVAENEDGVITVYAIGQKPTNDYTIQVTLTEVSI